MKIKVIKYDGIEVVYDILSFEFRTNQASNWIKIKCKDDTCVFIKGVCTIKTIE